MRQLGIDAYVIESLMPDLAGHDRQPSAFLVYLYLWRHTDGGKRAAAASLREIAEGTGLSKRGVQAALDTLTRRKLVSARRESITAVPAYALHRPWARRPQAD